MFHRIILLIIYLFSLKFLDIICYRYVFYKNRKFPLDDGRRDIKFIQEFSNVTKNNTTEIEVITCNNEIKGDMVCDSSNNIAECEYDGGDCCRPTCLRICEQNNIPIDDCPCGKEKYDCKSSRIGQVYQNQCVHGEWINDMNDCYKTDEQIKRGIRACLANSFSNGNMNTSNIYCGKDPFKNITHIKTSPNIHYLGCGIEAINCTINPCCKQVEMNLDTPESCDDYSRNRYVYDSGLESFQLKFISCIESYRNCFKENAMREPRGQCCICKEGYGGTFCDVPLCDNCLHGKCVDLNECECEDEYEGEGCNIAVCSRCDNGECLEPEKCECFYGFQGDYCEKYDKVPFCYHGKAIKNDKCECDKGYKGNLCEIKICYDENGNDCDACDEDGNCYKSIKKNCDFFHKYCLECDVNECLKCDNKNNYVLYNGNCVQLWRLFDNCLKGNENGCTECVYPYMVNDDKKCEFGGMIEINLLKYEISISEFFNDEKSENYVEFNISRYYGFDGKCQIDYLLIPKDIYDYNGSYVINSYKNNPLNFLPMSKGKILFEDGDTYKTIKLPIFPFNRYFIPINETLSNIFILKILNNVGNCIIGDIHEAEIEIYDDNNIGDIFNNLNTSFSSNGENIKNDQNTQNYQIFQNTKGINCETQIINDFQIPEINQLSNYFAIINIIDQDEQIKFSKRINYSSADKNFKDNITYNELRNNNDHYQATKKLEYNFCYQSENKIFKIEFFNFAGIVDGDIPYYKRYSTFLDIDTYYKINHIGYYTIKWSFYINYIKKDFYIKIIKNTDSYIKLIVNRKSMEFFNDSLNSDLYLEQYYKVNIDAKIENIEVIIEYIHISGSPKISVEYSEDKINYEDIYSIKTIGIFSCEYLNSYLLDIY